MLATQVIATLCEILAGSSTSATTLLRGVVAKAQAIGHGKEAKLEEHVEESPAPGQHAAVRNGLITKHRGYARGTKFHRLGATVVVKKGGG